MLTYAGFAAEFERLTGRKTNRMAYSRAIREGERVNGVTVRLAASRSGRWWLVTAADVAAFVAATSAA